MWESIFCCKIREPVDRGTVYELDRETTEEGPSRMVGKTGIPQEIKR